MAFVGLQGSVLALCRKDSTSKFSGAEKNAVTICLLSAITVLALHLKDLGFVAALTGSLMGSLIIYVFPALFRLKSMKASKKRFSLVEKLSTYGIIGTGVVIGLLGISISTMKKFTSIL